MVEFSEAGFFTDLVFQLVDGARGVDGVDAAAVGADEVIPVDTGKKKGEVAGALVEAEATDHAFSAEALKEAKDGGFVAP